MYSNKRACLAFIIGRVVNKTINLFMMLGQVSFVCLQVLVALIISMYLTSNVTVLLLVLWQTCMIWVPNHLPQLI